MKSEHGDLNNHLAQTFAAMKTNWAQSPAPAGVASDVSNAINSAGEAKRRNMLRMGAGNNLAHHFWLPHLHEEVAQQLGKPHQQQQRKKNRSQLGIRHARLSRHWKNIGFL